jgi:hypothetical protein
MWSLLAAVLLVKALQIEEQTKSVIFGLSDESVSMVYTEWDLQLYEIILQHWRTKCLLPSARGIISIMGIIQVQDFVYYLSYYSLPIMTAIFVPIVKIIISVYRIYCPVT